MIPIRLLWRFVRGGGAPGWTRLGLTAAAATAVCVGILIALSIPIALEDRESAYAARQPVLPSEGVEPSFLHKTIVELWDGEPTTVVYLADVSAFAGAPPGVERLPEPGEFIASPELLDAIESDPSTAALLPGAFVGEVAADGLVGPDERLAYVGVSASELPDAVAGARWGSLWATDLEEQQQGIAVAVGLLVIPAAIGTLWACLRLAPQSVTRRWAALRILGVRKSQVLSVAALESGLIGAVAASVALALSKLLGAVIAASGWLGFTWYQDRSALSSAESVTAVVAFGLLCSWFGAAGLRRSLAEPLDTRRDARERPPAWWQVIPFVVGLAIVLPQLLATPEVSGDETPNVGDAPGWIMLGGIALMLTGLIWMLRPAAYVLARLLDRAEARPPIRLAARRVADRPGASLRSTAGLLVLVLAAGASAGASRDFEGRWNPAGAVVHVTIDVAELPDRGAADAVWAQSAGPKWLTQYSVTPELPSGPMDPSDPMAFLDQFGVQLVTISCDSLGTVLDLDLGGCVEDRFYAAETSTCAQVDLVRLPQGRTFDFATADGTGATVEIPAESFRVDGSRFDCTTVFFTGTRTLLGWPESSFITVAVDTGTMSVTEFRTSLAPIAPAVQFQTDAVNLNSVVWGRQLSAALRFALWIAFMFAALAFGLAVVNRSLFERREVVSLMVLGFRPTQLRLARLIEVTIGLAAALVVVTVCAVLIGSVQIKLNDATRTIAPGVLGDLAPFIGTAVGALLLAGLVLGVRRVRAEDLRRE